MNNFSFFEYVFEVFYNLCKTHPINWIKFEHSMEQFQEPLLNLVGFTLDSDDFVEVLFQVRLFGQYLEKVPFLSVQQSPSRLDARVGPVLNHAFFPYPDRDECYYLQNHQSD